MVEHTVGGEGMVSNIDNIWPTFWVDKDFCLRITIFKVLYIINSYSMVSGAVAWPEDKVFFCEALNIVTKVLIRDEDNIIGVKAFNDLDAVS